MSTTVTQAANPSGNVVTTTTDPVTGEIEFYSRGQKFDGIKRGLYGNVMNFLPFSPLADWNERFGTGMVVELDEAVLFDGKPTIKITIPAGQTTGRIGTSGSVGVFPNAWDKSGFAVAVRCSNIAALSGVGVYLGEAAGFTNNYLNWGQSPSSYAQNTRSNEWLVYKVEKTTAGGIGWAQVGTWSQTNGGKLRLTVTLTSVQATDTHVWIGSFGIMQKHPKPTLVMTYDDCLESIYTHVYPLFKAHKIPATFAVISESVGTAGYMTADQIATMANDPSGLFEFCPHSSKHINVVTRGDTLYVQDVIEAREYIRGITGSTDALKHHAWVESLVSNGAIDLLASAGFLSARAADNPYPYRTQNDAMYRAGDKLRWYLNCMTTLGNTKTAAQMITELDADVAIGGFIMQNGHNFAATSSDAYTMSFIEHAKLVSYEAGLRDAGTIEILKWSDWWNTYGS